VSIPANIAEGHGREHLGDYLRHLSIANGSLMELETHLLIAQKLNYASEHDVHGLGEVSRMLTGLIKKLRAKGPGT
jgi:four helix bundle protein